MTIKELVEQLKEFPEDAVVEISSNGYNYEIKNIYCEYFNTVTIRCKN